MGNVIFFDSYFIIIHVLWWNLRGVTLPSMLNTPSDTISFNLHSLFFSSSSSSSSVSNTVCVCVCVCVRAGGWVFVYVSVN